MEELNLMLNTNEDDDIYTATIKSFLQRRILILNQEITDDIVEMFSLQLIRWNAEDIGLPVENRKKIIIVNNSPGGDCFNGWNLIDIIKTITTPVVCVCLGLTASMAYHIALACDERYAFENSVLLQHDGSIAISSTSSKAKDTMAHFAKADERTKRFVLKHTKMDEDFYDRHYDQEYYMFADEAKEMGCIDGVIGEDISLDEIFDR